MTLFTLGLRLFYSVADKHLFRVGTSRKRNDSESLVIPILSNNIVAFTPTPTPFSLSSISDTHRFMDFFRNRNSLPAASTTPTIYSVVDSIVAFTPTPTPHSRSSLSHTRSIHTPTLPTSTLLTFTCTQVHWFLSRQTRLTRTRASGLTTRPDTRLTIIWLYVDTTPLYGQPDIER